jgi:alpha-mannosidase
MIFLCRAFALCTATVLLAMAPSTRLDAAEAVYLVPNFHPASCGWLADFSTERSYCAYSYLDHLDRVREDPNYRFAMSEVNNIMAIREFEPQRMDELKQRIRERRVELVNAFFLEPTINLSGGEALVKMGVEGLRWQQQVMGVRPRLIWAIDVTGVHEQMGQIAAGLGLDGMVYTRDNPTGSALHWLQSPDGSRTLGISPGHYGDWEPLFNSRTALTESQVKSLVANAATKAKRTAPGAPILVLGGGGDYALPPAYPRYPTEFLAQWKKVAPDHALQFVGPSSFLDAVLPAIRQGKMHLPVTRSGARLSWTSFWIQCPKVKAGYRHAEHALQSAEAAATAASLKSAFTYPVQPLYHAWLELCLNMDRNTLWSAAGGMVFEDPKSWDARDRFESVEAIARKTVDEALRTWLGGGKSLGLFNPLSWKRSDPVRLRLSAAKLPASTVCQAEAEGTILCRPELPSLGVATFETETAPPATAKAIPLPSAIETGYYTAKIDPQCGALVSLKLKLSGREVLAGPVLLVAERGQDGHNTPRRPQRQRLADSSQFKTEISVNEGPLATVVSLRSSFYGGAKSGQTLHFYKDSPRIDFDTELNDLPDKTVVVAEFPLAGEIKETRRGIPYGFSHGAWGAAPNPDLPGFADGIQAAIRWSDYTLAGGGGVAILDRGLPGRELTGNTPVLFLLNAQDTYMGYPGGWLSGKGRQRASFALVAHEGLWKDARVPHQAWEFNALPVVVENVAKNVPASLLEASGNVIVEAVRREGRDIELRMAECLGLAGTAQVSVMLPHERAALTDLVGGRVQPIVGGPQYQFPVRPQQIVTMRLTAAQPVAEIQPLLKWDELVPPQKLAALKTRLQGCKGHPPQGPHGAAPKTPIPKLPADADRSFTLGKPATASNVYQNQAASMAAMAVDGNLRTRWATDADVSAATLDVDLGKPQLIGRALLSEAYDRVRCFEIQAFHNGQWQTFARGGRIGTQFETTFPPVTAQRVRLNISDAPGGPTIWEFMLFPPE